MSATPALRARLDEGLGRLGGEAAALGDDARGRLVAFVELLARWNRVHNLTAVRDPSEMVARHLLDSLALLPWIGAPEGSTTAPLGAAPIPSGAATARADAPPVDAPNGRVNAVRPGEPRGSAASGAGGRGARAGSVAAGGEAEGGTVRRGVDLANGTGPVFDLLDIGSGGGLPVLPLALARPDLRCLSVESNGKKARFQRQAAIELGLGRVEVREARIETVAAGAAIVVSRAFAAPGDFLAIAARHVPSGGRALVMLGRERSLPDPLPAPFELETLRALDVPFERGARHLAVCRAR